MDLKDVGDLGVLVNRLQAIILFYKNSIKKVLEAFDLSKDTFNRCCKNLTSMGPRRSYEDKNPSRSKLNEKKSHIK